jgi:hypothetical protein
MPSKFAMMISTCAVVLAACSNSGGTIYRKDSFGPYNVMSLDARQRLVIQGYRVDEHGVERPVICSEPSPDAIAAQAASLAASANVQSPENKVSGGGQLAAGYSEAVASIAMRTQTIQVLRDGYFRLCEAYLNGVLKKEEYVQVIRFIDEFITTVVAIEAIGGTVVLPPAAIVASQAIAVNKEGQIEIKPEAATLKVEAGPKGQGEQNAQQIRAILDRYYKRKKQFQMDMAKLH